MTLKLSHIAVFSAATETGCREETLHSFYVLTSNSGKGASVLIYLQRKALVHKNISFYQLM